VSDEDILRNSHLAELLIRASETADGHRKRALRRAARAAFQWPDEAAGVVADGRPLTELPLVGPWLARMISDWLEHPPGPVRPPDIRRGFLSRAEARAILAARAEAREMLRSDLQMHTTYSDGRASLREMVEAAGALGYEHVAITDHSKGLPIANGMDEATLARQADDIASLNAELGRMGVPIRALHSIEMNISPEGEGDMDPSHAPTEGGPTAR